MAEKKIDNVNHPSHYADSCCIECFDAMLLAFGYEYMYNHCLITAFKYLWRWKHKNGEEDVNKANWYLKKADSLYNDCDELTKCKLDTDKLTTLLDMLANAYAKCK